MAGTPGAGLEKAVGQDRALQLVKLVESGDLGPGRIVERPKIIYNARTKTYVMYMHVDDPKYQEAKVGVATSSTVCSRTSA